MEFRFNVNELFKQPIVEINSNLIPPGFTAADRRALWDGVTKVSEVINTMGEASAAAQGLTKPITTADRLRNSEHKIYLLIDQNGKSGKGLVTGMLKTGMKGLYMFDRDGHHYQVKPPCILDFYVHESRQRTGLGKQLFEHMLEKQRVEPIKLAIDRPSDKFLGFLNKHYSLNTPIKQMNNYVVFDGFFPEPVEKEEPVENNNTSPMKGKQSSNGLQNATSPYGRYGAPRPPCSMGQIIHNQSPLAQQAQEPTGVDNNTSQSTPTFQRPSNVHLQNDRNEYKRKEPYTLNAPYAQTTERESEGYPTIAQQIQQTSDMHQNTQKQIPNQTEFRGYPNVSQMQNSQQTYTNTQQHGLQQENYSNVARTQNIQRSNTNVNYTQQQPQIYQNAQQSPNVYQNTQQQIPQQLRNYPIQDVQQTLDMQENAEIQQSQINYSNVVRPENVQKIQSPGVYQTVQQSPNDYQAEYRNTAHRAHNEYQNYERIIPVQDNLSRQQIIQKQIPSQQIANKQIPAQKIPSQLNPSQQMGYTPHLQTAQYENQSPLPKQFPYAQHVTQSQQGFAQQSHSNIHPIHTHHIKDAQQSTQNLHPCQTQSGNLLNNQYVQHHHAHSQQIIPNTLYQSDVTHQSQQLPSQQVQNVQFPCARGVENGRDVSYRPVENVQQTQHSQNILENTNYNEPFTNNQYRQSHDANPNIAYSGDTTYQQYDAPQRRKSVQFAPTEQTERGRYSQNIHQNNSQGEVLGQEMQNQHYTQPHTTENPRIQSNYEESSQKQIYQETDYAQPAKKVSSYQHADSDMQPTAEVAEKN